MPAEGPLLSLSGIGRVFPSGEQQIKVLDDVSLDIYPGEFVAVMGQSGSGKSTLMNIMGCLDRASAGRYAVHGKDVSTLDSDALAELRCKTFGFIFQRYNLLPTVTALDNAEIPAVYAGAARSERIARAKNLLEKLGLADRMHHKPPQLSGGQQQRVAIARALMNDPPVILADEPTGALDSKSGDEVMALLKQLNAEGRTIILITHDKSIAQNAGRIIHISDGKIIREEKPATAGALPEINPVTHGTIDFLSSVSEAVGMALRALHVNLFRTALTLLGIVIGVASVVAMLAIGAGSKQKVLDQIHSMGTNLLYVQPGAGNVHGADATATLTPDDAKAVAAVTGVSYVLPMRSGRETVRYGNLDDATLIQGVGPALPVVRDWPVAEGNFFNENDMQRRTAVAVLGQTVKNILFPGGEDPVGRFVLIKNVPFEVLGVMTAKGASAFGGDQDDTVFVPVLTGLVRLFGQNYLNNMIVKVDDLDNIDATQDAITSLLKTRHRIEDFHIRNMQSFINMATEAQNTLTVMLGTIAAISLVVGGIGVMNIMLVSVTERTREIGIRMATGARMRDILLQFNIEAVVVCAVGGVLGVLLGVAAGWTAEMLGLRAIFSVGPAILAFASAFATGVVFGYLPARKAARLDPVRALSTE